MNVHQIRGPRGGVCECGWGWSGGLDHSPICKHWRRSTGTKCVNYNIYEMMCFFSDKRQKVFFVCVWAEVTVSILNPRK